MINSPDLSALKTLVAALQPGRHGVLRNTPDVVSAAIAALPALERLLAGQQEPVALKVWYDPDKGMMVEPISAEQMYVAAPPVQEAGLHQNLEQRIGMVKETASKARQRGHHESAACFEYAASVMDKMLTGSDEIFKKALAGGLSTFKAEPASLGAEAAEEAGRAIATMVNELAILYFKKHLLDGDIVPVFASIIRKHLKATAEGWVRCSERMPVLAEYVLIEHLFENMPPRIEEANWQGTFGWYSSRNQGTWVSPDSVKRWLPMAAAPEQGDK